VESRDDKRPTREAVKGSSGWIDVGDTLIGWHRPALFKRQPDVTIEALILKQRYGVWPLAVEFDFDPMFGWASNGRTIPYDQPGEASDNDSSLAAEFLAGKKKGRSR